MNDFMIKIDISFLTKEEMRGIYYLLRDYFNYYCEEYPSKYPIVAWLTMKYKTFEIEDYRELGTYVNYVREVMNNKYLRIKGLCGQVGNNKDKGLFDKSFTGKIDGIIKHYKDIESLDNLLYLLYRCGEIAEEKDSDMDWDFLYEEW